MPESPSDVWRHCLETIRARVQPQTYKTWFEPVQVAQLDPNAAVLVVPDSLFGDWLEENYGWVIEKTIHEVRGWRPTLKFEAQEEASTVEEPAPLTLPSQPAAPQIELTFPINNRYRFDNFVVGEGNEFAFSAAKAVAEAPGRTPFNPLVFHSDVGLGKTHLLQAIGHACQSSGSAERVVFVTAEKFISEYISGIRRGNTADFVTTYRTADVLLVDDIQFFLQTEGSQREFFHTFNTLFQNDKQIVLTSDCDPPNLKGFEPRLISRFQSGLVARIETPDLETRVSILAHKASEQNVPVPDDVIRYVAERHVSSVRELEGALTQLLAFAMLKRESLTVELVGRILPRLAQKTDTDVTLSTIQESTARFFGLSLDQLSGASRKKELSQARHIGMFLCKQLTSAPLKAIGIQFGRKDHTTVIHACKVIEERMERDASFRSLVQQLQLRVTGVSKRTA